jgi:16S rRNA (cytosine1402-N4)-methyltransferase
VLVAEHRRSSNQGAGDVHRPVLVREVLDVFERTLGLAAAGTFVDGTLGAGGHARAVLERFPGLTLLGCDWDPDSLALAASNLAPLAARVELVRAALGDLEETLTGRAAPVAILADVGVCSLHFDRAERGFSVQADGPLDMRMDPDLERTAADIVNRWSEEDLANLFFEEGGEHKSRRAAAAIVEARRRVPFKRTAALAELLERVLGGGGRIHPATRVFQALRRAVNGEGAQLEHFLSHAPDALAPGGVLALVTFHSGEDGAVKRAFAERVASGAFEFATDGAVEPSSSEIHGNPRARSARLRALRRVMGGGEKR